MTRRTGTVSSAAAVAMVLGFASTAWAQDTNTPDPGGQQNQCWGQIASQLAQLGTDDAISGGGMGSHSRSTTAADINGGFATSTPPGPTLNELNDEGNHGREGVGNVSATDHETHPGDGGNGVHAENNAEAATRLNPVTGQRTSLAGGTAESVDLSCDLP